jgi:hypothetical protein
MVEQLKQVKENMMAKKCFKLEDRNILDVAKVVSPDLAFPDYFLQTYLTIFLLSKRSKKGPKF